MSEKTNDVYAVYLNDRLVGYSDFSLVEKLKERRRSNQISDQVNIRYDTTQKEIFILTDGGRVRRPYIVVENGKSKLSKEIVTRVMNGELRWSHLVKMGVIEYLDAEEEENSMISLSDEGVTKETTHIEIHPSSIFGITSSVLPYCEYNSSPRITMSCSMTKQSLGMYASNFRERFDTRSYFMYYPEEPLVQTDGYSILNLRQKAAGQNLVVAIMSYEGYNMGDGIVINKGAVDRGLLRISMFKTYSTEERIYPGGQSDTIEIPEVDVVGYRGEDAYKNLDEDGIILPESEVKGRDVLIGKTSPPRFLEEVSIFGVTKEKKRENSVALKPEESGKVDAVLVTENQSGQKLVKVRIRTILPPEIGDKLSSRHGQKGVVGLIVPQEDMPFTKDGIVPDLLLNPHAIPSRMTAGHLLEMLGGKASALEGVLMDGTSFSGKKEEEYKQLLKQYGFDEYGEEELYNGITGQKIKAKIFIGNCYYQRLHHLVSTKIHVRSRGPVQLLTYQPTEGRAREGGLRFGEMERDCLLGYGASMLLRERLLEESDKTFQSVCTLCGSFSAYDYTKKKETCPVCGGEETTVIEMSYAFKLLLDEIKTLGIFPRIIVGDRVD